MFVNTIAVIHIHIVINMVLGSSFCLLTLSWLLMPDLFYSLIRGTYFSVCQWGMKLAGGMCGKPGHIMCEEMGKMEF